MQHKLLTVALLAPVGALSCGDPAVEVSYHSAVRPLMEAKCQSCHHDGGPAPYSFEYKQEQWSNGAPDWVESALDAVESGRMPPWMPAADCKPIDYDRSLTEAEKSLFAAWRKAGKPVGDPADYVRPEQAAPPLADEPTLRLQPSEAYTPSRLREDDYRCFLLDQTFASETYVRATQVLPSDTSLAHHALVYLIPQESVPQIEEFDAAEAGPGYTCFGGPGGGALRTVGGWVPGSVALPAPGDAAQVFPAGSRLVLQLHYNTHQLAYDAEVPQERSTVALWTLSDRPRYRIESLPLAHLRLAIDAGDPASVQQREYTAPADGTLISVAPHMHQLGTSIRVDLLGPASDPLPEPSCLVNIPQWDFNWQQAYRFSEAEFVNIHKGDRVRVTCTYDNSPENQRMEADGPRIPRPVGWGEGTADEMCLNYLGLMVPYDAPDFRCGAYRSCQATCADGDGACFFDCMTVGGGQCAPCMISATVGCISKTACGAPAVALNSCVNQTCTADGSRCITDVCAKEWSAFYACMEPNLESGVCDDSLQACGVSYLASKP